MSRWISNLPCDFILGQNAEQTLNHSATIQVYKLSGYLALYAYDILFRDIKSSPLLVYFW